MTSLTLKALHIIFVVTWFAGLFYTFRLFVYYAEALKKQEPARTVLIEQYRIMIKRLWYIISWPSAILTLVLGSSLVVSNVHFLTQGYFHVKLLFVLLLYIYQFYGQKIVKDILSGEPTFSGLRFRFLNEIPTVILIAVVFLIVLKDGLSWIGGVLGIIGIAILLTLAIKAYKQRRESH
ncbi:MAG: CopD family protein [Flavobacteriales bacterium]|nr:CopD family protein [Flavobacteriales bacterium]